MTLYGEFPIKKILTYLAEDTLLPAIVFRTSRRQCDLDVEQLAKTKGSTIPAAQQEVIRREVSAILKNYNISPEIIEGHPHYGALIHTGVGAHHAGQLLVWRLLLEELMTRSLMRLMIATGTVAAGVDFPARSVVVTSHSKRGSDGFQTITSSEFQQMSGRAGRRGKDSVGICLIAPGPYSDARVIHEVSRRPPEPLRSSYFAAPATVLNLLKFRNVDDLKFTVAKSLASFLDRKTARAIFHEADIREHELGEDAHATVEVKKRIQKKIRRLRNEGNSLETRQEELLNRSLDGLRKLGYLEGGGLSDKGYWAAELCTNLVLELAEAISDGLFDDVTTDELVALVASIAGDPHRVYFGIRPNPIKKDHFRHLERIIIRVRDSQANPIASDIAVLPTASLTLLSWMECADWTEFGALLRLSGVADGDAARLITQTADHLNQISRLSESHPELARMAFDGRQKILRPPLTEAIAIE